MGTAVIQAQPRVEAGLIEIGVRRAPKIPAWVILPNGGTTIACPLEYFQEHVSLANRWITVDDGSQIALGHVRALDTFTVTLVDGTPELDCALPQHQKSALLKYFMKDVARNTDKYVGFDCYAFVSFLSNTAFQPENPPFTFQERNAVSGDVVVFADGTDLPSSIKHWALCAGDDLYLSKFGQAGRGAQALVEMTTAAAIRLLYACDRALVANRMAHAPLWNQERWPI